MSETWGANPDQLRDFAKQCGASSQTLTDISANLSAVINNPFIWKGPDAERTRDRWNSVMRLQMISATTSLDRAVDELIKQAEDQQRTSDDYGGPGGPGTPGAPGTPGVPGAPGSADEPLLAGGLLGAALAAFRNGWSTYGLIKAPFTLMRNAYGIGHMFNLGMDAFTNVRGWEAILNKLPSRSIPYNLMDSATDLLGAKNLQKYIPQLRSASGFFAEKPWLFAGGKFEWLGKGGLGRGLGWLGVGLSAYDTVESFVEGDVTGGLISGARTALGVACFLPPPAGTVAQVASVAWAAYDFFSDPGVQEWIGDAGQNVADFASDAVDNVGDFAEDVGEGIQDLGSGVADFLGFG